MSAKWKKKLRKTIGLTTTDPRAMAKRLRALSEDHVFARETEVIKRALTRAYESNPEVVKSFFRRFPIPGAFRGRSLGKFLGDVPEEEVREVLLSYAGYASRFQVAIPLHKSKPHFRKEKVVLSFGPKFQAKVAEGQLMPLVPPVPDEDVRPLFESERVQVPDALQPLIDSGFARFIHIKEDDGSSMLTALERIGYHAEGVTVVVHEAEQPYLYCLFGEKVSKRSVHQIMKVISAYQREFFPGRGKGGRRPDIDREREAFRALDKPGSLKEKASKSKNRNLASEQVYFSRKKAILKH